MEYVTAREVDYYIINRKLLNFDLIIRSHYYQ